MNRLTETVLLFAILGLAYLAWLQQQEIVLLTDDVTVLRRQVGELAKPKPAPRRPRTPKTSGAT